MPPKRPPSKKGKKDSKRKKGKGKKGKAKEVKIPKKYLGLNFDGENIFFKGRADLEYIGTTLRSQIDKERAERIKFQMERDMFAELNSLYLLRLKELRVKKDWSLSVINKMNQDVADQKTIKAQEGKHFRYEAQLLLSAGQMRDEIRRKRLKTKVKKFWKSCFLDGLEIDENLRSFPSQMDSLIVAKKEALAADTDYIDEIHKSRQEFAEILAKTIEDSQKEMEILSYYEIASEKERFNDATALFSNNFEWVFLTTKNYYLDQVHNMLNVIVIMMDHWDEMEIDARFYEDQQRRYEMLIESLEKKQRASQGIWNRAVARHEALTRLRRGLQNTYRRVKESEHELGEVMEDYQFQTHNVTALQEDQVSYKRAALKEGRKLCRKVKVLDGKVLKHFHNGDFNKDYDRALRLSSILNFMKDPTGDLPWEEDPKASPIHHLPDPQALERLIKKSEKKGLLVMFYAPWCGFCKKMKPDYVAAATEIGQLATLAAIDVNRPENNEVRKKYNITGFPTLFYFRNGQVQFQYEGENTKEAILAFLRDPDAPKPEKAKEMDWTEEPSDVVHLNSNNFNGFIEENPSVLVMFYAPWCGHCKRMKPAYVDAAEQLKELQIEGRLAAVDATKEFQLAQKFDVKGYPTIKYFRNGVFAFDAGNLREEEKLIEFMRDPKEPPPPPPPEKPWKEEESAVVHLDEENFQTILTAKEHALVMFYAPWCGHCKAAKPEFTAAADEAKENDGVVFGAVDCTVETSLCKAQEIKGYPTFKHFHYFNQDPVTSYNGPRTKTDFGNEVAPKDASSSRPFYPDWNGIAGQEHVRKLTGDNVAEFIKNNESVMVMFYAPWCGHCTSMKPDYARAAASLAQDSSKSVLAALDCVQYPHVTERYAISGYPTLKYYHQGSFIKDYRGHRRTTELINFMLRAFKNKDEL